MRIGSFGAVICGAPGARGPATEPPRPGRRKYLNHMSDAIQDQLGPFAQLHPFAVHRLDGDSRVRTGRVISPPNSKSGATATSSLPAVRCSRPAWATSPTTTTPRR
ncbi:MAG: hypothetical protein ACLR8Y_08815 [Alistipes indistinctus]